VLRNVERMKIGDDLTDLDLDRMTSAIRFDLVYSSVIHLTDSVLVGTNDARSESKCMAASRAYGYDIYKRDLRSHYYS